MRMQALSVVAPWGQMIAAGRKTVEVRSWQPAVLPLEHLLIVENDYRLTKAEEVDPNGRALAIVRIVDVHAWLPAEAEAACAGWEAGWLAWVIDNVRPLAVPFPVVAARHLYEVEIADILVAGAMRLPCE